MSIIISNIYSSRKFNTYILLNLAKNINKIFIFMFYIIRSLKFTQTFRYSQLICLLFIFISYYLIIIYYYLFIIYYYLFIIYYYLLFIYNL